MPIKLVELDLSRPIQAIEGVHSYEEVRVLVRHAGTPLGWITIPKAPGAARVPAQAVKRAVGAQLGWPLVQKIAQQHVLRPEAQDKTSLPLISVVICTRDRTEHLRRCLEAVLKLDYPDFEVVVVDNASRTGATQQLVASMPRVRYVREDRPGLDWARNRGMAEARADLIAFTDDDTRPDHQWLKALAKAFSQPDVMAVTGLVLPMELETDAQIYFECIYGGMGKGFRPRWVRGTHLTSRDLLWASALGVGANMAVRRSLVEDVGGFDVALDVGTPARGGGDIEFFHRVVAAGHTLLYAPSAIVWHCHRRSFDALRAQLSDNGCSFGNYLLTCARNGTVGKRAILSFTLREWIGNWLLRRLIRPGKHARKLILAEIKGLLQSPFAYRKAQLQAGVLRRAPH